MRMTSTERFENYINEQEISQPRTPAEFISWFEEKLEINRKRREELRKQMLLREGDMSEYFYNELLPLYCLLKNKSEDWKEVNFLPIKGSQNFDVKVQTDRKDVPKYIEITNAYMNKEEYAINSELFIHRHVNIRFDSKDIVKNRIKEAIDKKMYVTTRPECTALLLCFDDYNPIAFPYDKDTSKHEMGVFLDPIDITWQDRYIALYVVGVSGNSFYERRQSS